MILDFKGIEKIVGYHFEDKKLLEMAMTHSSHANERRLGKLKNNERLEFLGDAVLELITSDYLFEFYPDLQEGDLTKTRASIVCEQTLAFCARNIGLGRFILLGKGEEKTGGRERNSILSDAFEALIGAIYLDGGFANAKEFVLKFVLSDIKEKQLFYDSKTILQEYVQGNFKEELSYVLLEERGPDHEKNFLVAAKIGEKIIAEGSGKTKKAAEQVAAYHALLSFEQGNANKK